ERVHHSTSSFLAWLCREERSAAERPVIVYQTLSPGKKDAGLLANILVFLRELLSLQAEASKGIGTYR
ncbi:MAG: hypothetical protein JRD47_04930, partial [Deltaproteobacteria bacterium]|nr:hypothetical protein [Deltaproteobacteria bacterium]